MITFFLLIDSLMSVGVGVRPSLKTENTHHLPGPGVVSEQRVRQLH